MKALKNQEQKKFDTANLTVDELRELADEIRQVITGNKGVTLPDYIKAAGTITPSKLGYRKSRAIKCESSLVSYFPDEVFSALQNMTGVATRFDNTDDEFLRRNINKDNQWLSDHLYINKNTLYHHIQAKGWDREAKIHEYTKAEENFLRENFSKGVKWLSDRLNISKNAMICKLKRMKLWVPSSPPSHVYTKEELAFIRTHVKKGSPAIAKKLGLSSDAIYGQIRKMGLTAKLPQHRAK